LIWSGGDNYLIFTVPYKTNYRLFNFPCSYKSIKTCLLFQEKLENYSIQVPVWKSVRNPNPVVATFIIDSKSTRRMILKVEPDIQVDRYRHTANSTIIIPRKKKSMQDFMACSYEEDFSEFSDWVASLAINSEDK